MKNILIFIGSIGLKEIPTNGETAKNQVLLRKFEQLFDKVHVVDSYYWRRNPFCLIKMLWLLFFKKNAKVIVSCHRSGMPVLNFIERTKVNNNVFYWAIGSGLMEWIREGAVTMKACKYMKRIVVESTIMVKELEYMGLKNVSYLPNTKPVTPPHLYVDAQKLTSYGKTSKINFVFLSRIIKEKGCFLILDCCKKLNKEGLQDKYTVTFYGDKSETPDFLDSIDGLSNVFYKGILNLTIKEGYKELSSYDIFLFPTFYSNEGFPGVLIDALMCGLPIIATDWKYNLDVIKNNYNGLVIPPDNVMALYETMRNVINDKYDLKSMSSNCIETATKYDVDKVLTVEKLKEFELL